MLLQECSLFEDCLFNCGVRTCKKELVDVSCDTIDLYFEEHNVADVFLEKKVHITHDFYIGTHSFKIDESPCVVVSCPSCVKFSHEEQRKKMELLKNEDKDLKSKVQDLKARYKGTNVLGKEKTIGCVVDVMKRYLHLEDVVDKAMRKVTIKDTKNEGQMLKIKEKASITARKSLKSQNQCMHVVGCSSHVL